MNTPPTALTIAGSDSGGGAGLQADLRTFFACGVHGTSAVTAVTVQNSRGVRGFTQIAPETVVAQMTAVAEDMGALAAKTGMLASAEIIDAVCTGCDRTGIGRGGRTPLVLDPVAASMHGDTLLSGDALEALRSGLIPRATVLTPNLDEVRLLTGIEVTGLPTQREAAKALLDLGPAWVLIKGGHLRESPECLDLLSDGDTELRLSGPRNETPHTHGGGDTFAAAITASLADGCSVPDAATAGKRFIERAVAESYPLGAGIGPVSPFWRLAEFRSSAG